MPLNANGHAQLVRWLPYCCVPFVHLFFFFFFFLGHSRLQVGRFDDDDANLKEIKLQIC